MHGLILAGGEGSRLLAEGEKTPKPLLAVGGKPQIVRLVETLAGLGCDSVACMVRDDFPKVAEALRDRGFGRPVAVHLCHTPSSLHTLAEGLAHVPPGPVFATMVDTVMRPDDWRAVYSAVDGALSDGADAVLAVTPYVDDESALYVVRDGSRVTRLSGEREGPVCVTGGVYGLSPLARRSAAEAVAAGLSRMRAFLVRLVAEGRNVVAAEVPRIIDLDRLSDLAVANAWLAPGA